MKRFLELGREIKREWGKVDYAEPLFPEVATRVLARYPLDDVSLDSLLEWSLCEENAPSQSGQAFGNAITVFHDERFYVDILTWIDGTTAIHEHAFSGAFRVLSGSSLHARYRFLCEHSYSAHLHRGVTTLHELELLRVGDVRPIHCGAQSAHALFHLDRPSLTVVVRTPRTRMVQLLYARSGLAFDEKHEDEDSKRVLRSLSIMHEMGDRRLIDKASVIASKSDALTAYKIEQFILARATYGEHLTFVQRVRERHGLLFEALARFAADIERERWIISRRKLVHNNEHRFLLALLLNLQHADDVLAAISKRVPDRDPVDTALRWLDELTRENAVVHDGNASRANVVGLTLDEHSMGLMRILLIAGNDSAQRHSLLAEYETPEQVQVALDELSVALRQHALLSSLFTFSA